MGLGSVVRAKTSVRHQIRGIIDRLKCDMTLKVDGVFLSIVVCFDILFWIYVGNLFSESWYF